MVMVVLVMEVVDSVIAERVAVAYTDGGWDGAGK